MVWDIGKGVGWLTEWGKGWDRRVGIGRYGWQVDEVKLTILIWIEISSFNFISNSLGVRTHEELRGRMIYDVSRTLYFHSSS